MKKFNAKEVQEIKKVFSTFQKDRINLEELSEALKNLGRDPVETEFAPNSKIPEYIPTTKPPAPKFEEQVIQITKGKNQEKIEPKQPETTIDFDDFCTIISFTSCEGMQQGISEFLHSLNPESNGMVNPKKLRSQLAELAIECDDELYDEIIKDCMKNSENINIDSFVVSLLGDLIPKPKSPSHESKTQTLSSPPK